MKLGIIGTPQSGKTTVFNAAAAQHAVVGDYSQASHRAIIKVPDERVDRLAEIHHPERKVYPEIELLDAPGFTGKGKESKDFNITGELREVDALIMVIDAFSDDASPRSDIENLTVEIILSDQVIVENNIENKTRKARLTGDKSLAAEVDLLKRLLSTLEDEKPLLDMELSDNERKTLRGYQFLSLKPVLVILNIAEDDLPRAKEIESEYSDLVTEGKRDVATLCGKIQMELIDLEPEEREEFLADLGITEAAMDKVIRKSYSLLGLISFLTTGSDEVRAWTVRRGTRAVKAAGTVHSDMERGFIRAEVTRFEDIMEYKTPAALKAAGKIRLEGKDYIVRDGDEIHFRFNV
jgi:hypothetical protein